MPLTHAVDVLPVKYDVPFCPYSSHAHEHGGHGAPRASTVLIGAFSRVCAAWFPRGWQHGLTACVYLESEGSTVLPEGMGMTKATHVRVIETIDIATGRGTIVREFGRWVANEYHGGSDWVPVHRTEHVDLSAGDAPKVWATYAGVSI